MMKRTLIRNIFTDDARVTNKKLKFIGERICVVEKNIPELKNKLSNYVSKRTASKKALQKIVEVISNYAEAELVSTTVKESMEKVGSILLEMEGHEGMFIEGMEADVLVTLDEYGKRCKFLRSDVKAAHSAADREVMRQRQLQRFEMLRDQDPERVSVAQADLLKSKAENAKTVKALEEHADIFEHQKIQGLRSSLLEWITHELRLHARALELFTDAYQAAKLIDVESDLEEFRTKMYDAPTTDRLATVHNASFQRISDFAAMDST